MLAETVMMCWSILYELVCANVPIMVALYVYELESS